MYVRFVHYALSIHTYTLTHCTPTHTGDEYLFSKFRIDKLSCKNVAIQFQNRPYKFDILSHFSRFHY